MPKTKIVCTIGPACADTEIIVRMIRGGMGVARLNFSHGNRETHAEMIRMIRAASGQTDTPVAILQDLRGPKIRIGEIAPPGIHLDPGNMLILTTEPGIGVENRVFVSYPHLPGDVSAGDTILLADGLMELVVIRTTEKEIHCKVITGGTLTSHKGINLPSGTIRTPAITEKDRADLAFGLAQGVDYVAMSFVRHAEDVRCAREIIADACCDTPVIAKIEKHEALNDIDNIIEASDGIMVARGDLGVEIPLEKVPGTQKMLVHKGNEAGKPVIIATQMLRSMLDSPRPTRAEATDVANAVLDGADALMLSEETATGNYPVQAVEYMARIIRETEEKYPYEKSFQAILQTRISESVAHATCILSDHLAARAIIATTKSGYTAHQIARFRPKSMIIAVSPDVQTVRRLALYWGCMPGLMDYTEDTDEMFERASAFAIEKGHAQKGDLVVITAGHPMWETGTTNMISVRRLSGGE
ncbi:MAG: pyruvate kinase [Desulfobacteraceae bacterium]|nr:pyruvate kinase [Desulfobacteraceae bacterium]MCF8094239.1 pyruvate kinase [Desulfobacteraceae bacterium]